MFQGLAPDGLIFLTERGKLRAFGAGYQLVRQGEPSRSLHIVLRGCVRVERLHPDMLEPVVLAELGPGEAVAGLGVLGGQPRSTTVTAIEETETLELDMRVLAQAVLKFPELSAALLHGLSHTPPSVNGLGGSTNNTH